MAISLQKPNMLGSGNTFGSRRTASASTTAAQNLSSGVRPNAFSFRNVGKKGWVSGQNTIKGYNQYNYQRTRAALNPRTYTAPTVDRSSVPSYTNVTYQPSSSYTNGMKWGMGISIGMGILNSVAGMVGGNNNVTMSAGQRIGDAISSLGGNTPTATSLVTNSDVALSISNMASCNDSESLGKAIESADNDLQGMESMTPGLEAAETKAQDNLNALDGLSSAAEKEKATAQSGVSDCKNSVSSIKAKRDVALGEVKTGNQEYDNAVADYTKKHDAKVDAQNQKSRAETSATRANQAYTQAQNATASAQSEFDNTPATITDANGNTINNPAKAVAKAKLEQAKAAESNALDAKTKADNELKDATTKEQEATDAENKAKEAKQTAYENLGDLKAKADDAEKALKQEQDKLDSAKNNLLKANKNLDETEQKFNDLKNQIASENSVVNLLKTHKNDVQALKEAIHSEKSRLSKIQKTEKKEDKNKAKLNKQDDS